MVLIFVYKESSYIKIIIKAIVDIKFETVSNFVQTRKTDIRYI